MNETNVYQTNTEPNQPQQRMKKCKYCHNDMPAASKKCPHCFKRQNKGEIIVIIIGIFFALMVLSAIAGDDENSNETTTKTVANKEAKNTKKKNSKKDKKETATKKEKATKKAEGKKDYIASCKEYKYKDILRNPEDYKGKRIKVTIKIYQKIDGGILDDNTYYRGYSNDDYDMWVGDEYLFTDMRENSDFKILDDDIITIYGEYDGVQDVDRAITSTTDEVPIINAKYATLVSE